MSIWIPNQPVIFGEEANSCLCNNLRYRQLIQPGDVSQVQFQIESCAKLPNLVENGSFDTDLSGWTVGSGWAWEDGKAKHTGAFSALSQPITLLSGNLYLLELSISDRNVGNLALIGFNDSYFFNYNGNYSLFISPVGSIPFSIMASSAWDGYLDDVSLVVVPSNYIFSVWDINNNYIASASYKDNPEYFKIDKNTVTFFIDWSTLGVVNDGCYYVCLHDPCTNTNGQNGLYNGDFTIPSEDLDNNDKSGWAATFGPVFNLWTISGNRANYFSNINNVGSTINQQTLITQLQAGLSYTVTYTILSISNAEFAVSMGGTFGTIRNAPGTYTETIVSGGNFFGLFGRDDATANQPAIIQVDNVSIKLADPADLVCNSESNLFSLKAEHPCTITVNACNDADALGFNFETSGFSPFIRLHAKLTGADYATERSLYRGSQGFNDLAYYRRRKAKLLKTDREPIFIHDFLSLLSGFDHVYINNAEYFVEDEEYSLITNEAEDDVGAATIKVGLKTQPTVNAPCSEGNGCALNSQYLLQADDNTKNILLTDGQPIIINS